MKTEPTSTDLVQAPVGSGKKRDLRQFLVRWGLTIALLALAAKFVDVRSAVDAVEAANPVWLVGGLALNFLGTIWLPSLITLHAMAVQPQRISLARLVEINLTNRFYVLVLPRAAAVAVRWYRYGQGKLSTEALALMVFERGIQLATLMVLALFAIWLDYGRLGPVGLPLVMTLCVGTILAILMLLPFANAGAERTTRQLLSATSRLLPRKLAQSGERLVSAAAQYRTLPHGPSAAIVGWSVVATLMFYASAWCAAKAIGLEISLLSLVWVRSAVFLLTLIPITVGGIGVRELGFVGFLALIGIANHDALAFSAVNFSFQIALALVGALLEMLRLFAQPQPALEKSSS